MSSALREDQEFGCRTLLNLLAKRGRGGKAGGRALQLMMLDDLLYRIRKVPPEAGSILLNHGLRSFLPKEVVDRLPLNNIPSLIPLNAVDIAFVTIKPPELLAAKVALGISRNEKPSRTVNGLRFWEATIFSKGLNREAKVVLTMLGEQGNSSCAVIGARLLDTYAVKLCILIGIAAGVKGKTKLADCVAADLILDYEQARLEADGKKKRPRPFEPDTPIARDLQHFQPHTEWSARFREAVATLKQEHSLTSSFPDGLSPEYMSGVILAGEKLIADGSLPDMKEEYHERVRAAEMEGAGFARLCREFGVPWLVFRGVADFGDPQKGTFPQVVAALSACTAALDFVTREYTTQQRLF